MHASGHLLLPKAGMFELLAQFPGVALFFIISGFLVTDSYVRSRSVADFAYKRALRIYPALVVNLLVLEFLFGLTGGIQTTVWAYLKYLSAYLPTASNHFANMAFGGSIYAKSWFFLGYPSGVLWTLTVELSFYVVLPAVLIAAQRRKLLGTMFIFALMAGSFSIAHMTDVAFSAAHPSLNELITPYFWIFGLGVVARLWWAELYKYFEDRALYWVTAYALLVLVTTRYFGSPVYLEYKMAPDVLVFLRVTVMACVVLSVAFTAKRCAAVLRGNDFSYGLYLWHMLGVSVFMALNIKGQWWLWIAAYGIGFLFSAASWFLIEKPFLRLKRSTPNNRGILIATGFS